MSVAQNWKQFSVISWTFILFPWLNPTQWALLLLLPSSDTYTPLHSKNRHWMCCVRFLTSEAMPSERVVTCQIKNILRYFFLLYLHIFLYVCAWVLWASAFHCCLGLCHRLRIVLQHLLCIVFQSILSASRWLLFSESKYLYNMVSYSSLFAFPVVRTHWRFTTLCTLDNTQDHAVHKHKWMFRGET